MTDELTRCAPRLLAMMLAVVLGMMTQTALAQPSQESPWPAEVRGFKAPAPGEHPRLFFRKSDLPELRQRAATDDGKVILQRLRQLLDGKNGDTMPEHYNPNRGPQERDGAGNPVARTRHGEAFTLWHGAGYGMLYQLTGEQKYADLGRKSAELMLEGQRDRDNRYSFRNPHGALRAGPSLSAMAMAYDLCYDGWDEDFRQTVARAILAYNEGNHMSLAQLARGSRHYAGSNHWGGQIGGAALALLAIRNDPGVDRDTVEQLLETNSEAIITQLTRGFGDGGYFREHAGPGGIGTDTAFVPALQAWKVAGGKDFITPRRNAPSLLMIRLYELTTIGNRPWYMLRHPSSYGTGRFDAGGDRNGLSRGGQFAQGFMLLDDDQKAAALWIYNHIVEPNPARRTFDTVSPYPHRAVLALVNWPMGIEPRNPAQVMPRTHADLGHRYFVFRNKWEDNTDIIVTVLGMGRGARDGQPIMVWAHDMKLAFARYAHPQVWGTISHYTTEKDGSGRVGFPRAPDGGAYMAVDFSGKSGAEAVVVAAGTGAIPGENQTGRADATAVYHSVTLGQMPVVILTIQRGEAPAVRVDGNRIRIGEQTLRFDGEQLLFGS